MFLSPKKVIYIMSGKIILIVSSLVSFVIGAHIILTRTFIFKTGVKATPVMAIIVGALIFGCGLLMLFMYYILFIKKGPRGRP